MLIQLNKFGSILVSRPAGKEAFLAFQPTLRDLGEKEEIRVDFKGIEVLTPSWIDEFLVPLINIYKNRIHLVNVDNPSVEQSLKILGLGW